MKILVLGIGNLILQDEGVGIQAIQQLENRFEIPPEIEVLDGGTSGMELLTPISDAEQIIILDAVTTGKPAGTIVRLDNEEIPTFFRTKVSPHQVGLADVLAAATLTGSMPRKLVLFGVEPLYIDLGMELSEIVAKQMPRLIQLIIDELKIMGVILQPKGENHASTH
jgi:hydrogenase maturation protease